MTMLDTDLTTVEDELAEAMRLTHLMTPPDNFDLWIVTANALGLLVRDTTGQMIVDYARANHLQVIALCGYRWVPVNDPEKYDVCGICMDEATKRMQENKE